MKPCENEDEPSSAASHGSGARVPQEEDEDESFCGVALSPDEVVPFDVEASVSAPGGRPHSQQYLTPDGEDEIVQTSGDDDSSYISSHNHRNVSFSFADDIKASDGNIARSLLALAQAGDGDSSSSDDDSASSSHGSLMEAVFGARQGVIEGPRQQFATHRSASVRFHKTGRTSLIPDLHTGREGMRAHHATLREESTRSPQPAGARRRRGFASFSSKVTSPFLWGKPNLSGSNASDVSTMHGRMVVSQIAEHDTENPKVDKDSDGDEERGEEYTRQRRVQYRLRAIDHSHRGRFSTTMKNMGIAGNFNFGVYEDSANVGNGCKIFGIQPTAMFISYLHWTFRSGFMVVILSACGFFVLFTSLFALLLMNAGYREPDCIHVNGEDFGSPNSAPFMDAYALSWTTFSTVGYGLIFPGTSAVSADISKCTGITVLTTLESFVGILFASMWGAILFAKVSRVASVASVDFSEAVVVRYGSGVVNPDDESSMGSDDEQVVVQGGLRVNFTQSKLPCPVLEFRIANRRAAQIGGEIIDATLSVIAIIDEDQVSEAFRNASHGYRLRGKRRKRRRGAFRQRESSTHSLPTLEQIEEAQELLQHLLSSSRPRHQSLEDDLTGTNVTKKIFIKLELESQEHPFFKRVWLARHVLNQHSPLLKQDAKKLIRLNGGRWPTELNNAEAVHASLCFDNLVVSLSGTSNADAYSVYAQKVYDYQDLCVGYRFCDILYRDSDGKIAVDHALLNDVKEQRGGGGEDLQLRDEGHNQFQASLYNITTS